MEVQTSIETERGCGFRKPGLYLMGPLTGEPCERLPFPFFGGWPKFTRGFGIVNPAQLFGAHLYPECLPELHDHDHAHCPVCTPPNESHYLMWAGRKFYTPESFLEEARTVGISKRIATIPTDLQFGRTWVFLAHLDGAGGMPGCITAFKPTHVDLVVEDETQVPDYADELNESLGGNLRVVKVIPDTGGEKQDD